MPRRLDTGGRRKARVGSYGFVIDIVGLDADVMPELANDAMGECARRAGKERDVLKTLAFAAALTLLGPSGGGSKIQVIHFPPGNPGHPRIITISVDALPAHLAHGDHGYLDGFAYAVEPMEPDAEEVCMTRFGGHLASVHSQAEDDFISLLVDPTGEGHITALIGGYEATGYCDGPDWTYLDGWTDSSPWNFENGRRTTGEPSCSGGHGPAIIQFWPNTNGSLSGWNDIPAAATTNLPFFVCKYQP